MVAANRAGLEKHSNAWLRRFKRSHCDRVGGRRRGAIAACVWDKVEVSTNPSLRQGYGRALQNRDENVAQEQEPVRQASGRPVVVCFTVV